MNASFQGHTNRVVTASQVMQREPEVSSALNRLRGSVEVLEKLKQELKIKLAHVISPSLEKEESNSKAPSSYSTQLAVSIDSINSEVNDFVQFLNDLLKQIEL